MSHASLVLTIPLAALLLALAFPAGITASRGWSRRLKRRGRLGLHTPAALASDDAFDVANRVSAPLVAGAAIVGAVCATLVIVLPLGILGAIMVAILGFFGVLGQLFAGATVGERAARTVPLPARKPESGGCCGGCGDASCSANADSAQATTYDVIPDLVPDAALH
ncbi:MAG: SdpI family protein [Nakamurella sp.]